MKKKVFMLLAIVLLYGTVYGETINVNVDIKPKFCPNPLNTKSKGFLPVAVLGSDQLDVYDIDFDSVTLNGVSAASDKYKDVSTPVLEPGDCNCNSDGPDGVIDLVLKFRIQDILETLGPVYDGDEIELSLVGLLSDTATFIEGTDCVLITVPGKQEDVSVPDVVDLTQAQAETAIINAGLTVGTITADYSDTIIAGNVISQYPSGGDLLPPGGAVDLVISLGPIIGEIVWLSIDDPGFTGEMSQCEITNEQYCVFLNAALASGDITVSGNDAIGAEGTNIGTDYVGLLYYDGDGPGYSTDGATYGGAARINYSVDEFTVDSGFEDHPVTYVTYYGAMAFCNYYGYTLPTELEWQAVADHTVEDPFTYGCGTSIYNDIANYLGSAHPDGTTAVGDFGAFGYGMCDMAGNVWEWTDSIYSGSYRVLRGGTWSSSAGSCTVAFRNANAPTIANFDTGFRVCLPLD